VPKRDVVDAYRRGGSDKHAACNTLLEQIKVGVGTVTIEAPDFNLLQTFRAMRRMYKPANADLTAHQRFHLMKAFSEGYEEVKDETDVKALHVHIEEYRSLLKQSGIPEHKVERALASQQWRQHPVQHQGAGVHESKESVARSSSTNPNGHLAAGYLTSGLTWGLVGYRCALLLFYFLVALPGTIMAQPMLIVTSKVSKKKAEEAVAKSSVKLAGRDVLATWKVLVSLVMAPLMHLTYTFLCWFYFGETASVVWFFFAPFVAIGSIFATERATKLALSIRTLVLVLRNEAVGKDLIARRTKLQHLVREVVKKYSWDRDLQKSEPELYQTVLGEDVTSGSSDSDTTERAMEEDDRAAESRDRIELLG